MADNSQPIAGGDIYSTDQIVTLNGASIATGEKAQRVKVGWGDDGIFNDATMANPLPVVSDIDQSAPGVSNGVQLTALSYPSSTGNNTTTQLAAGATFTGVIETVLSLQAAQIEIVCDQPYTVFIDQFIDQAGVNLSSTYSFTRPAGVPVNENVTLPGNYMRVRVQNTGASATTTFRLDTTFGIMDTLPNTLSNSGNLRVAVSEALPAGTNVIGTTSTKGLNITGTSGSIAAAGTGTIGPLDVSAAGNITFTVKNTIAASAYAGAPVIVFEQSDDNVSYGPLLVTRNDTGATASTVTLTPNVANGSLMFDAAMEGVNWVRARVTTGPATNAMTVSISGGGLPFSPAVAIMPQPITKAVQGTSGITTQDLKDAGRVLWSAASAIAGVTAVATEALVTMIPQRDGTAAGTATSHTVTAGKRLRITAMTVGLISTGASVLSGRFTLRIGASSAATATSPILHTISVPSGAALAQAGGSVSVSFPEGIEIGGSQQIGVTQVCSAATGTIWVSLTGYEY